MRVVVVDSRIVFTSLKSYSSPKIKLNIEHKIGSSELTGPGTACAGIICLKTSRIELNSVALFDRDRPGAIADF